MTYEIAIQQGIAELRSRDPYRLATLAEVEFDGREFVIPYFARRYTVRFPEMTVKDRDSGKEASERVKVVLFHYLVTADGTPLAGEWIAYRQLEGGYVFEAAFNDLACEPLVRAFGDDLAGFRRAAPQIGGRPMDRTGDAAYWFQPLPRLLVACVLYGADEEMPASANVIFDAAANHYLPTEDLASLGSQMTEMLVRLGQQPA